MIAVLIAVAVAFLVAVFATPVAIGYLRRHHIGAQIRDDGPVAHPHEAKAGTPTMGGVALVAAAFLGYLAAHIRSEAIKFADTAITLWVLILGMFVVGFIDDYLGVRKARNLGLRKRGKTFGILLVTCVFAVMATQVVHVNTHLSFTRPLGLDLGTVGWIIWCVAVVYAMTNAVNITDGLDGLLAGSGRVRVRGVRGDRVHPVPPPGQVRHRRRERDRHRRRRRRDARRLRRVPLVERAAGQGLHGRRRLARARRRDGGHGPAHQHRTCCCRSSAASTSSRSSRWWRR